MEILNAYRPKKIFDKDICCDYRVKEDISDTLVEVIREFLIVNYQSKIASGLCGNYQKILYCWRKKTSVGWHVDMRGVTWSTTGQSEGFTTCHHCTICCLGQNWTRFAASTTKIRGEGRVSNILTGKEVEITALCSKCFGYWEIITCFNSSVLSLLFEISVMGTQCQFEDISIYCKWSSEMNSSKEFWHIKMYFNVKNSPAIKSEKPISSKQCSSIWKHRVNFLKPKGLGRVLEKSFEALHASLEKFSDNYYVKDVNSPSYVKQLLRYVLDFISKSLCICCNK